MTTELYRAVSSGRILPQTYHSMPSAHGCNMLILTSLCSLLFLSALVSTADVEDNVIVQYETDTHSRYEAGQPGKAVRGFYR